ncbi:hypothetical protein ASPZODRAFT_152424 [Penicilliopsis zonata CBS 506.65]|uniref:Methyltransferase type 11 domain-containing protein n=1 Tax=Penicilliopsis zonata CBS 506.65 TaxID=1073090 RepID=A0A1L9SGH3_9EURO|nr:hypothetical protein ASPZODRAFT_152424 [Penicilliopsis zonata CBS 506.65]OJJ46228.1 hypothetical protein ASPZODRAFT_152424 [Penicilliopsis zonata CBS 506.65]
MSDLDRIMLPRCPPLRQARGTVLNTIIEDNRETQYSEKPEIKKPAVATVRQLLTLNTKNLPPSSTLTRFASPRSADTQSTSSDNEWEKRITHFDDLYDATDIELSPSDDCDSLTSSSRPGSLGSLITPLTRHSSSSIPGDKRLSLVIPSECSASSNLQHKTSPLPPPTPSKIPVSSEALSMIPVAVPALHAPPSLDGSLSSDQISNISTPMTPELHSENDWSLREVQVRSDLDDSRTEELSNPDASSDIQDIEITIESSEENWAHVLAMFPDIPNAPGVMNSEPEAPPLDEGVVLPENALSTLRCIQLDASPDPWSETSEKNNEMWQLQVEIDRRRRSTEEVPSASASSLSDYSFSSLSIPSPGGFFASLNARARHTWSFPHSNEVPSTATARNFYDVPWNQARGEIIEQVIECPQREDSDDEPTAKPPKATPLTAIRIPTDTEVQAVPAAMAPDSPASFFVNEIPKSSVVYEYDENYDEELKQRAVASLDRTSFWLTAQATYLAALRETNPINDISCEADQTGEIKEDKDESKRASSALSRKRSVRFADIVPEAIALGPSIFASKDSIYWRGFQAMCKESGNIDTFLHQHTRFEAIQSNRLGSAKLHRNCLQGKYEIVPYVRPPYKGPFSKAPRNSVIASTLVEKAEFARLEKEQAILAQLSQPMWAVDAFKFLYGGNLVPSPASKRLLKAKEPLGTPQNAGKRRIRVLDLGGQGACEWAWKLAHEYPNVKVYTVITKQQIVNQGIKGPANHRLVSVPRLWNLPFHDKHFDLISARSLHSLLKAEPPVGEQDDEYDLCLKECYRCLKPGGYLEFFVMDAAISQAGPYASATSIEFEFNLRTRGYDPNPTKKLLGRLRKSGFVNMKRAWLFLPVGVEASKTKVIRETPDPAVNDEVGDYEAVHGPVGSTTEIASLTGVLGGWIWEQWLLKLRVEMGHEEQHLLDGIGRVFAESRKNNAGWTCLSGWGMKPKKKKPVLIQPNQAR